MLTRGEFANTLYKLERYLEDIIVLHLQGCGARDRSPPGNGNGSARQSHDHWVERAARQKAAVKEIAKSTQSAHSPPPVPELERLEDLLEKQQEIVTLLDRLIAHTPEPMVLDSLRELLMDALDDWDAIARRVQQWQTPMTEQRCKTRIRTLGDLVIVDEQADLKVKGRCLDFSYEGLAALVCADLPIGACYALEFSIMGTRSPAKAMGEVRWCRPRTSGDAWRIGFQLYA